MGQMIEETEELLDRLETEAGDAATAFKEGDFEVAQDKLVAIDTNLANVLMRVNIASNQAEGDTDDKQPITEVAIESDALRHAISMGDLFTVHEIDGHVFYLEIPRKHFESLVDAEENPAVNVLDEHFLDEEV